MAIIGDLLCLHVLCDYILLSKISVRELLQYYNDRSYVQNTEDSVLKQDLDMLVLHCCIVDWESIVFLPSVSLHDHSLHLPFSNYYTFSLQTLWK